MEIIELTGYELYELLAQIRGIYNDQSSFKGFINEIDLTEGTKRLANRIAKKLVDELEILNKHRVEIQDLKDGSMSEEELKLEKVKKDSELMKEKIKIEIEKLDFSKVENSKLSENYQLVYDKIFK